MEKVVDYQDFMTETGLEQEEITPLYEIFLEEICEEEEHLLKEFHQEDWETFKRTIHNVKGILGSYRAMEAFYIADKLNEMAQQDKLNEMNEVLEDLIKAIGEVKNFVKKNIL